MADEAMTATSPAPTAPPTAEVDTNTQEDVPMQEAEPSVDKGTKAAVEPEALPKTNGEAEQDTLEMNASGGADAPAEAASSSAAAPPEMNTTAAKKGTSNGGSSKKKAAVPEHKSKKPNKKKSRPLTNLDAQPGEYYLARMKGHPPWPSVICDEEMLPNSLLTTRPVTARMPDKKFRKPEYEDGGKRAHERTYPIMFLHTNEFAWMPNTDLTPLDPEDEAIKNPSEKGKSKTLLAAYAKAAEANDLQHFKTMLAEHQKALQQDMEEKEAAAERAAAKKAKKSRKSSDAAALADDGDEMDVDDDEGVEKPKSKKRKKPADSDVDEKPAKTPKTGAKLKLSTPKAPAPETPAKKKSSSKPKAKATKSSSEDDAHSPKIEEKSMTPEQVREIKERKVLYYRHKLQRGLLSRDSTPKEEEMKPMSDFLRELEGYPDLEGSIIRVTKIHKVLKQILKLNVIPLEHEYRLKDRSRDLLAKWNETLSSDPTGGGDKDDGKDADEPKTPGLPAANGERSKPAATESENADEVEKAAAPEEASATKLENKIGTSTEGAKEADEPEAEEKAQKHPENAEEKKDDGPAVETAPSAEFKPVAATDAATEPTA